MPKATQKTITSKKVSTAPDPILARLDVYRKLEREFQRLARLEDEGRATEAQVDVAADALEEAGRELAKTRPATIAGASAMLTLITAHNTAGFFTCGQRSWHETAFKTVTAGLAKLARAA
jgi:hypothetical protein